MNAGGGAFSILPFHLRNAPETISEGLKIQNAPRPLLVDVLRAHHCLPDQTFFASYASGYACTTITSVYVCSSCIQ